MIGAGILLALAGGLLVAASLLTGGPLLPPRRSPWPAWRSELCVAPLLVVELCGSQRLASAGTRWCSPCSRPRPRGRRAGRVSGRGPRRYRRGHRSPRDPGRCRGRVHGARLGRPRTEGGRLRRDRQRLASIRCAATGLQSSCRKLSQGWEGQRLMAAQTPNTGNAQHCQRTRFNPGFCHARPSRSATLNPRWASRITLHL